MATSRSCAPPVSSISVRNSVGGRGLVVVTPVVTQSVTPGQVSRTSTLSQPQSSQLSLVQALARSGSQSQSGGKTNSVSSINLNVRVMKADKKSQYETYVLRNLGDHMSTPTLLKKAIHSQLGSDIVSKRLDFSIGYIKSSNKISIRDESDVQDVWDYVRKKENVTLWCDGVSCLSSDSDDEFDKPRKKKRKRASALEERNNKVEEIVYELREQHKERFTTIQYRLWAEMFQIGTHKLVLNVIVLAPALSRSVNMSQLIQ